MDSTDIGTLLSMKSLFNALFGALIFAVLLSLVLTPSLLRGGVKVRATAEALYCFLMLGVGVLLMTIGAIPTLYSVLAGIAFDGEEYIALLAVFAIGGGIFLWYDAAIRSIEHSSKSVPSALYHYLFKILGRLIVLFASLSLGLNVILKNTDAADWWAMPVVMIAYGLIVCWCTRDGETEMHWSSLPMSSSTPVRPLAVKAKKVTTKVVTKKANRKK